MRVRIAGVGNVAASRGVDQPLGSVGLPVHIAREDGPLRATQRGSLQAGQPPDHAPMGQKLVRHLPPEGGHRFQVIEHHPALILRQPPSQKEGRNRVDASQHGADRGLLPQRPGRRQGPRKRIVGPHPAQEASHHTAPSPPASPPGDRIENPVDPSIRAEARRPGDLGGGCVTGARQDPDRAAPLHQFPGEERGPSRIRDP